MILFNFKQMDIAERWSPVDDVVMGGISTSRMTGTQEGTAVFSGEVSLDNNGGFASITSPMVRFDLSAFNGIAIHARGDGKRYAFVLRCGMMRPRYQAHFESEPDLWETVYLPFSRFKPVVFGSQVATAPEMNRKEITTCGFMISDKQTGPFRLEVAWIAGYPLEKRE